MNGAAWLGPVYWEGACTVSGSHRGLAYVELLGSLAPALARAVRPGPAAGPLLARAVQHPVVTLALATMVGHAARAVRAAAPDLPRGTGHPAWPDITTLASAPRQTASRP
jgi:hypothetical protein